MVKLAREDVLRLAKLSSLQLSDKEVDRFATEIATILAHVEQLQAVDLDNISATTQVTGLKNVTRKDQPIDYKMSPHDLLQNAPQIEDDHIKVWRMIA